MTLNFGQSNLANQIHVGGNRIPEIQPHHQDLYSSDVSSILSQFVNGFRDQVQHQGNIGSPQQQSFSTIQITPDGNGNEGLKEITAIVYNSETGAVKQIPALIYATGTGEDSSQLGSGPVVSTYPHSVQVVLQDSNAPANAEPCQKGPENIQKPVQQEEQEDFIAAENASPEPTPGVATDDTMPKSDTPSQEEINKKYPVTILTPDSTVSVDTSNSNSSTEREAPAQATETSEFSPETSTVIPADVGANTGSSPSLSDDVSGSITSSTAGPPPEWDVLTENLKAIEGETTVSDVESPTPK
jgi:hypothetical protein